MLQFRELDYFKRYGIDDITAESVWDLAKRLSADENLHKDYLIRKLGMDPSIPEEVEKATEILLRKHIVVEVLDKKSGKESISTWPQLCLMTQNLSVEAYDDCLARDPTNPAHDSRYSHKLDKSSYSNIL